jgi:glycerophosphoryl diester phosphodiesterase
MDWAIAHGAKAVEYDVILATDKDGAEHIVMIEPKLINTLGVDINNLSWETIKDLDAGNGTFGKVSISHLEDVLQLAGKKIAQQIQLKGDGNPRLIPALLSRLTSSTNFILTAFNIDVIKKIKETNNSIRVGWLVKPQQEAGGEGTVDLTALVRENPTAFNVYTNKEIATILEDAKKHHIEVILLCGPRIIRSNAVKIIHEAGLEIGAWGVGTDLELARKLIEIGIDRFTIDNPEQL